MSEERKYYTLKKLIPHEVLFSARGFNNSNGAAVLIDLTNRRPTQRIPVDLAFGMVTDNTIVNLFAKNIIAFVEDEFWTEAYEAGAWLYQEHPGTTKTVKELDKAPQLVLAALQKSDKKALADLEGKFGRDLVKEIAIQSIDNIPLGMTQYLERLWNIQLTLDEDVQGAAGEAE